MANFGDIFSEGDLTKSFNQAATHLQKILPNVEQETVLNLYGLYKQAMEGPCNIPKPSWYDMKAKYKWEAWFKLKNMSKSEAQETYVQIIKDLDPAFDSSASKPKEFWVSVSKLQNEYSPSECQKTIVDLIQEGNVTGVKEKITGENIDRLDQEGLGLIHWAADIGNLEVLELIIDLGGNLDLRDFSGQTALHYASSCGNTECATLLLKKGANFKVLDNSGNDCKAVALDDNIKALF